jgi:hypothetical protein
MGFRETDVCNEWKALLQAHVRRYTGLRVEHDGYIHLPRRVAVTVLDKDGQARRVSAWRLTVDMNLVGDGDAEFHPSLLRPVDWDMILWELERKKKRDEREKMREMRAGAEAADQGPLPAGVSRGADICGDEAGEPR